MAHNTSIIGLGRCIAPRFSARSASVLAGKQSLHIGFWDGFANVLQQHRLPALGGDRPQSRVQTPPLRSALPVVEAEQPAKEILNFFVLVFPLFAIPYMEMQKRQISNQEASIKELQGRCRDNSLRGEVLQDLSSKPCIVTF